jgi:hypothetical protein
LRAFHTLHFHFQIASLSEEERSLMSNHLTELDAELESKLVNSYILLLLRTMPLRAGI